MELITFTLFSLLNWNCTSGILKDTEPGARIHREIQVLLGKLWVRPKPNQGHATRLPSDVKQSACSDDVDIGNAEGSDKPVSRSGVEGRRRV